MGNLTRGQRGATVCGLPWAGVHYFCTTRQGGVSTGPYATFNMGARSHDDPACVADNRRTLRNRLPADPHWLRQEHGTTVFDADTGAPGQAHGPHGRQSEPVADAAVTARPDVVLAILTADCLPIVIAASDGRALGIAHAGWRGLAAGVLEQTMIRLRAKHPDGMRARWRAWVGPGISQNHFEVGADVYSAFVDRTAGSARCFVAADSAGKWRADLPELARLRLRELGVDDIELSGYCTYGQPASFYSYRRQADTGRMATVAWLSGAKIG